MANNSKSSMSILNKVKEINARIAHHPEVILGRGHTMPFNNSNSGARKLLASSQSDQVVPIKDNQLAIVATGSENQYGDRSSSIIKAEGDYEVLKIIDKYSFMPKYHYFIIFHDLTNRVYKVQECRTDRHITEKHGFHYNIDFTNQLNVGDIIKKGTVIRKSESYDEYGNRTDGTNVRCLYMATDRNTEDSIIISDELAERGSTTHFMNTEKIFNSYSRLLDLYGDDNNYKCFPDIGEHTKNNRFCAIRTANKEEELYTYTRQRLKEPIMSDDSVIVSGTLVDIDISCNDPEALNTFYNQQLKKYWDESIRFYKEIKEACDDILNWDSTSVLEYDLKKLYDKAKKVLSGTHFTSDGKEFNFIRMEITLEEEAPLQVGDKMADRFGGKGVISAVIPKEQMPVDEFGNRTDAIINSSTCVNRENPGQLFETSLTYISENIIRYISKMKLSGREAMDLILKFFSIASPVQYEYYSSWVESMDDSYIDNLVYSIIQDRFIYMSLRPIQDNMTVDKLCELYDMFPFIKQAQMYVPIVDSNGNIRFIPSKRRAIHAMKYMYRLKQFSEDKFSATSLSATNLQNLNAKSKTFKRYKSAHSNTPIAKGHMETDDLLSVGEEYVITDLMLNSVSPNGRRLMKEALTGDPFILDIKLTDDCANRNVEKLNAYQMAKGVALRFSRKKKKRVNVVSWDTQKKYKLNVVGKIEDPDEEKAANAIMDLYNFRKNDKQAVRMNVIEELTDKEREEELKKFKNNK